MRTRAPNIIDEVLEALDWVTGDNIWWFVAIAAGLVVIVVGVWIWLVRKHRQG